MSIEALELKNARYTLSGALFTVQFARSGGPGGQNVNKVETKVELRLNLERTESVFGPTVLARIKQKLSSRLDAQNILTVSSSATRSQKRNLDEARQRMKQLLEGALEVPKQRRATRPTRASKEERMLTKKLRGERKQRRQHKNWE